MVMVMPRGEANALKDECPKGHPLTGANVRISKCKTGERRVCRKCVRIKASERYYAAKGA